MKTKAIRKLVSDLFPAECGPVFEHCYTAREIRLVASAFQIAAGTIAKLTREKVVAEARWAVLLEGLEDRIKHLEQEVAARQFTQVRPPEEIIEQVVLTKVNAIPVEGSGQGFKNRLSFIKAIRDATPGTLLKDAKDMIDDVIDKGTPRVVFKGSQAKAAVVCRVLAEIGGETERKESI